MGKINSTARLDALTSAEFGTFAARVLQERKELPP
jgi:hypothetical protein